VTGTHLSLGYLVKLKVKKVKLTPEQARKDERRRRGIALHFL
jgi:hypothetical protein